MTTWREYAASLRPDDHRRLVLAIGAGLREARLASQVMTEDGDVAALRDHLAAAVTWLEDARALLLE